MSLFPPVRSGKILHNIGKYSAYDLPFSSPVMNLKTVLWKPTRSHPEFGTSQYDLFDIYEVLHLEVCTHTYYLKKA
jgi:hypothetical protein